MSDYVSCCIRGAEPARCRPALAAKKRLQLCRLAYRQALLNVKIVSKCFAASACSCAVRCVSSHKWSLPTSTMTIKEQTFWCKAFITHSVYICFRLVYRVSSLYSCQAYSYRKRRCLQSLQVQAVNKVSGRRLTARRRGAV